MRISHRRIAPRYSFFTLCCAALLAFIGCTNSTGPSSTQSTVTMESAFSRTSVTPTSSRKSTAYPVQSVYGATADSLQITSARMLIKDIKLHHAEADSTDDESDAEVRYGPFVAVFDSGQVRVVASSVILAGTYDRIKFEIHQYDHANDDSADLDRDDSAAEFKTADRYTVLVTGWVWSGGVRSRFEYRSRVTGNITWHFAGNVQMPGGSGGTVIMQLDPVSIFQVGGLTLDPRDPLNQVAIDLGIRTAIHLFSKL